MNKSSHLVEHIPLAAKDEELQESMLGEEQLGSPSLRTDTSSVFPNGAFWEQWLPLYRNKNIQYPRWSDPRNDSKKQQNWALKMCPSGSIKKMSARFSSLILVVEFRIIFTLYTYLK